MSVNKSGKVAAISLTCSWTWSICVTLRNVVSHHPSIDFFILNPLVSNPETELPFVRLNKLSLLSFPNNCLHLV